MGCDPARAQNFRSAELGFTLGEVRVLHLIEADPAPMVHEDSESLRLEHISFRAEGMAKFITHLETHRIG
ncbi:hypothetical protein [Pararhizobium sp. IMCC21322]|uniref:hypothetical protein n=1 Tax=Pararhizobium sp. IMCC21322 TaxID=3067903 RepID=UPI002741F95D|nr:hypothetical protein [Pararhizobium sp. IMCC21322]